MHLHNFFLSVQILEHDRAQLLHMEVLFLSKGKTISYLDSMFNLQLKFAVHPFLGNTSLTQWICTLFKDQGPHRTSSIFLFTFDIAARVWRENFSIELDGSKIPIWWAGQETNFHGKATAVSEVSGPVLHKCLSFYIPGHTGKPHCLRSFQQLSSTKLRLEIFL